MALWFTFADEPMHFQHARPVTLKRADIKTQLQNTVSGIELAQCLNSPLSNY